jgi:hypothetical protein
MANDNDGLTFFAPTETKLSDRKSAAQEGDEKRQLVQSIYAMVSDTEAPDTNKELLEAFERATIGFNLCPNRVWAVAKEKLPKLMPNSESISGHEKHEICNFDFCEYSQRDFTGVEQRHECKEKKCGLLQYLFSRDTLEEATTSTVWGLDGKSMIDPPQPYNLWQSPTCGQTELELGLGQMEKTTNACTPFLEDRKTI